MADWFETRFRELAETERLDPAFAARVRALVRDEWAADAGPAAPQDTDLGVADADAAPGEIIMLETEYRPTVDEPAPPRRGVPGRWLLVAASVALVAVIGAVLVDDADEEVGTTASELTPGPSARAVPQVEEFVPLEPGRWFVDPDGDPATSLQVSFDLPAGWSSWLGTVKFSGDTHSLLSVTTVDNLVQHACTDHSPADPPVGPSVDDLATALGRLAPFEVTEPASDVTAFGYEGKHIQLARPELPRANDGSFAGCDGGSLATWFSPLHDDGRNAYYGYDDPGLVEDFWILDVEGTRLVLTTTTSAAVPAEDVAELEAIFDSIRIEP